MSNDREALLKNRQRRQKLHVEFEDTLAALNDCRRAVMYSRQGTPGFDEAMATITTASVRLVELVEELSQ